MKGVFQYALEGRKAGGPVKRSMAFSCIWLNTCALK